jgi:hypothetical protein
MSSLEKLLNFRVSEPTFWRKLQKENNWSIEFAEQAYTEYIRFVYLCAKYRGQLIVPSNTVDEVWHLHLTYTRSYWTGMCRDLLGFSLHHNANEGGKQSDINHVGAYEFTKAKYEEEFGEKPKPMYWEPTEYRFSPKPSFIKVKPHDSLIINKKTITGTILAGFASLSLTGCQIINFSDDEAKNSTYNWIFFIALIIILLMIFTKGKGGGGVGEFGCGSDCGSDCGSSCGGD